MSEFYKKFLTEEARRLDPDASRAVALAAFGKHPGWDDHVEDLGLDSDSLILAKRVLYVQGVGGQIDTGAWEKLKDDQRIPEFNHSFLWRRPGQFLVGRMWSSSDGKGRTRYPMILCAHCIGPSVSWGLQTALPRLVEAEKACRAVSTAAEVRSILREARASLQRSASNVGALAAEDAPPPQQVREFSGSTPFGPNQEGWFRILYWLQSQAAAFSPGKFQLLDDMSGLRPQQLRAPLGNPNPAQAVPLWNHFLKGPVDNRVPELFVWFSGGDWVDIILGEPSAQEFFCLRAARSVLPLATEVPYDLDAAFRAAATRELNRFQSGEPHGPAAALGQSEAPDPSEGVTRRIFKKLTNRLWVVALLLVLLGGGAIAYVVHTIHGAMPRQQASTQSGKTGAGPATPIPSSTPAAPAPSPAATTASSAAPAASPVAAPPASAPVQTPEPAQPAPLQTAPPENAKGLSQPVSTPVAAPIPTPIPAPAPVSPPAATSPPASQPAPAQLAAASTVTSTVAAAASGVTQSTAAEPMIAAPTPGLTSPITNSISMILRWVPNLPGVVKGGWVGQFEVTQAQYEAVCGSNPSVSKAANQPVENVTWQEAADFCRKLNGREKAAGRLPDGYAYALPTEEQWDFFLGDSRFENAITSRGRQVRTAPAAVGTLPGNQFGLRDVLGNVWEWCADGDGADQRVLKGSGYSNGESYQFRSLERTTARRLSSASKAADVGFRCVLVVKPAG